MSRARAVLLLALLVLVPAARAGAKKVDVGGHRLRVEFHGKSGPVVVFDSGIGDSSEAWRWVWPEVARFARVVLYDRAGIGRSDPGPTPRTSARIVAELHALLAATGMPPPYVLVGHSFGGLNLRLYASRHPEQVAALVLVEPTPLDYPEREPELLSEFERSKLTTLQALGGPGLRAELEAVRESAAEVRLAGPLPELPVVVLTSSQPDRSQQFREQWLAMQRALAASVGARRHEVTDRAGHYIQFDAPELVIEAIREVTAAPR